MYIPKHFQENNQESLYSAIKEIQVAHVITQHFENIEASFIPLYLDEHKAEQGILYGHIARANIQWKTPLRTSKALAIFTGSHHYITPSWYPAKQTHHKVVPTWNYVVIHVHGEIEFIQDTDELLSIVTKLTNNNERNFDIPWHVHDAPTDYIQKMLKVIIGVKITITHIEGKYKLSQNQDDMTQQHIIDGLKKTTGNRITSYMKTQLDKK